MHKINVFWFRRDIRLSDNAGLYKALSAGLKLQPVFIFDKNILNDLPVRDQRVGFIHQLLLNINDELARFNSSLWIAHEDPLNAFKIIMQTFNVHTVYTNHDYEPYARSRDSAIGKLLKENSISFITCKDQVIFEKNEIVKDDGKPYTVFTPYNKKWRSMLQENNTHSYPSEKLSANFVQCKTPLPLPSMPELGFEANDMQFEQPLIDESIIKNYHLTRDYPFVQGTSKLSVHLRFGTLSIRELARTALRLNEKFLNELIWRDFYQCLLWHFPQVVNSSFRPAYDKIIWRNQEKEFAAWCSGHTGYPIVDAGMRELNSTGWMHNRVRMIVASFLTKHLLIDWRWGEAYFAEKLMDYDLASNNGGWQWAAGCGADAAPYFRIFNPAVQTSKFDKHHEYIRKWVPEFESPLYPKPIVEHTTARERCLQTYKAALNS